MGLKQIELIKILDTYDCPFRSRRTERLERREYTAKRKDDLAHGFEHLISIDWNIMYKAGEKQATNKHVPAASMKVEPRSDRVCPPITAQRMAAGSLQ